MQERIKSRRKACLHAANAKVDFPSRSGIAYFAKVGPKDDTLHLYALNGRAAMLDDLYICYACDAEDAPDLMLRSGKHTEEHHLIRCLAPKKADDKDKAALTEERLTSIEGRLDGMQTQLDDLTGRVGDITGRIGDFPGRMNDLTGYIGDLNARMGNIEQLLHKLVGGPEGRTV
jgi:hypothetical protein